MRFIPKFSHFRFTGKKSLLKKRLRSQARRRTSLTVERLEERKLLAAGVVGFELAATEVNEQAGYRSVNVLRSGGSEGPLTVNFATADGTATAADGDYVASSGTLVFADGETQKAISVQIANAGVDTAGETFQLLISGDPSVLGAITANTITINDTPTITGIGAQSTAIGTPTAPIAFTVGDAETSAGSIALSATSSNPQLVPLSNIVFGGTGASRTVTVTPVAGLSGSSRIYIIATDASGAEITSNFTLQVGNATTAVPIVITAATSANSVPNIVLGADDSFTLQYTTESTAWGTNVTFVELDNPNLINNHGTGTSSDLRTQPTSGGTSRSLRVRGKDNSTSVGEYGTAIVTLGFTGAGAPANAHAFNVRVNPRAMADNNLLAIPGTTNTFDVLANDATPLAGHDFLITGVSGVTNGTLAIGPDGKTLQYTSTNLSSGIDRFSYTVTVNSSDAFNGYTFTGQAYVKIGGYVVVDSPTAAQHIDLDFDYVNGDWIQRIRTDAVIVGSVESGTFGPSVLDSDEGVIFFDPSTKQPRNAAASLDVLGVPAGADVWFGPTSSNGNKVFLGIATESTSGVDSYAPVGDSRATSNANWVAVKLVGFNGPGHFAAFNGSDVAFDTFDGLNSPTDATSGGNVSDTFWTFAGSHAHPGWYFTAAGRYELTFETTVRVGGQFVTSPPTTFTFDVDRVGGNARLRENQPTLKSDAITIAEDSGAATINVLANDNSNPDGFERLIITTTSAAANGTVTIASNGQSVSYTPSLNYAGTDSFTYTVTDEHGGTATAMVSVTVTDVPDAVKFAKPETIASTLVFPWFVDSADINGDGNLDALAISSNNSKLAWYAGNGDGSFAAENVIQGSGAFTGPFFARAVDLDGDNLLDVVTAHQIGNKLSWYKNLGSGVFSSETVISSTALASRHITFGDIDTDGDVDLVVPSRTNDSVSIYKNNGNGTFAAPVVITTSADAANFVVLGDLDGDSDLDIAVTSQNDDKLSWLRNDGLGNFGPLQVIATTSDRPQHVIAADLDGDSDLDLAVVSFNDSKIAWFQNNGAGVFGTERIVSIGTQESPYSLQAGDLDRDGDMDIVAVSYFDNTIAWYENTGAGTFGAAQNISSPVETPIFPNLADYDKDGDLDILVAQIVFGNSLSFIENRLGESVTQVSLPPSGNYFIGQTLEFQIYFGLPVNVSTVGGVPSLPLNIGGTTVQALYAEGSGTSTLIFRHVIQPTDVDTDGIGIASSLVLNGGSITHYQGAADLALPSSNGSGILVDGASPLVVSVLRDSDRLTDAASVEYLVTFSEPVTGVDASDFVITTSGALAGASVSGISGSGANYTETIATGTGDGTIRLDVVDNGTIVDSSGRPLAGAANGSFIAGQVFTIRRDLSIPFFENFVTEEHHDVGIAFDNGEWNLHVHVDRNVGGSQEYQPNEILITSGPASRDVTPLGSQWDFLGTTAGSPVWIMPQSLVPGSGDASPGISAEEVSVGTFAAYYESDPRVDFSSPFAKLSLAGIRGPAGGHLSVYQTGFDGQPIVWMATSDGITDADAVWVPEESHDHYSWAFSKPGLYEIDLFTTAYIDVNGNGTLDLGVDTYSESGVVTYYMSVDHSALVPFALPKSIGSGLAGISNVNTADFNADGKLDVLAGAYGANKLVWFQGNGDGTLGSERLIDSAASETWFNTPGDLDNDGDIDVLAGMYSGTLAWYANNGSGTFTKNVLATDIVGPYVRIGDLNGDGRNDILAGPDGGTTIFYFQQLPTGGFASRQVLSSSFTKLGGIHLNDFDFDGDLDVFAGDYGSNELSWFVNNGSGVFGARQFTSSQDSSGLDRVVDLTGDGRVDLLSLEYATGKVSYYPQLAGGGFGSRVAIPLTVADSYALAVADFDNDGDNDIADGAYGSQGMIAWVANEGAGTFQPQLQISTAEGQVSSMTTADLDGDGDVELVVGSFSEGRIAVYMNRLGEFATEVVPPATGTYLLGQKIDTLIHFGYPVSVSGTPSITLQIGSQTIQATYLSGSGTPSLTFRYSVVSTDSDSDGVQFASFSISLNDGSITDPFGNPVDLTLPINTFSGVLVNGDAPFVQSVTRLESQVTTAASVEFLVTFSEAVQNVDVSDFNVIATGDLVGVAIASILGAGNTRTVTVDTGSGSGTIGLHVKPSATISDLGGQLIGTGYAGGEVYTLRRSPPPVLLSRYTAGHGDIGPTYDGAFLELAVNPDNLSFDNDEVEIYGNADAITARPLSAAYDFIGVPAGQDFYLWTDNGAVVTVPELGISGEGIPGGTFASYFVNDPRINASGNFFKFQMTDVRSTNSGYVSVYSENVGGPTVWMASSDGLSATDAIWLQQGSHQHFSFAFSKPGRYEVDFVTSGFRDLNANGTYDEGVDPYIESGVETVYFGIDYPTAKDDAVSVSEGQKVQGNILLNDRLVTGDPVTIAQGAGVMKGSLTLNNDGSFIYIPSASFDGTDSFVYSITNGRGGSSTATVRITSSARPDFEAVLKAGHADIGVNFEDGAWDLHIHKHEPDTEYEPSEAMFYVGQDAIVTRSGDLANAAFDFLGAAGGSSLFILPETENTNLLFLGIGGEELGEGLLAGDVAKLQLASVSGPGEFSIWQAGLSETTPKLIMATYDGVEASDAFEVGSGNHSHVNFAFSKLGYYEVTFVASGFDAGGNATDSGLVTYYFQVGNTVENISVQNGQTQRSFVRNVDVVFGEEDSLEDMLAAGRVQVTKFDLNGNNPSVLAASAYAASVAGDRLRLDFGVQGIGGNRNTNAGDGYYRVGIDVDGDGAMDSYQHFYRLLGDVNGDRVVNATDRTLVLQSTGRANSERDVNGDGIVNSADFTLVSRAIGKKLKDGLWVDA